ncbi:hypothetical protein ASF00_00620 [Sphingomonas sp. Leaf34]|uniref:hypothetical protein n=1 Tax=Sphingomonas sp. Leaf34 TaxID=1736216 RepID=UPI000700847D|nr:hypothetical protein [Sphingomonas sp. Leaf34]KQN31358.1 hypothetical protein ASF00_00620 [Sphingomonas sp. Leaf34]
MKSIIHVTASALSIALVALPAAGHQTPAQPSVSAMASDKLPGAVQREAVGAPGYADIADLVLSAPVIADATVRSTAKIKPAEAPNLAAGLVRLYVEVDVTALIRGADGLPPRIGYLLDVAPDSAGRIPKFKKARVLIFAKPVAGAVNQVQLVAPDAQVDWTPTADARARQIAKGALASDAPPVITGIGNAFHVAGALPGEGETQIFLTTADQRPVSLSIIRRPGEQPRWAVALSEIVDESAAPPAPETLLWYRLACALPQSLPERSTGSLEATDATIAREDYAFVIAALGPCGRTRKI